MELEHHQGRKLLQSDGIVASTSFISSLPLKLFFPSRFSTRKMLRFTSFSLPRFLESLDLSGTPICFLPESIKDLGLLRHLYLINCKMLQALTEFPSHLDSLDVSFCYSLPRYENLNSWTEKDGCAHLVEFQDGIKQELIQKFDSHVFRIMETISAQIQTSKFQITFMDGIFNVAVSVLDEDEMLRRFCAEGEEDKWLIQNEFVDNFSFKISSPPPAHRICGFNLFISCVTSAYRGFRNVYIEIRNNTSGQSLRRQVHVLDMRFDDEVRASQSLSHWKLGGDDPTFDSGDDVTISMVVTSASQIRTVGVQWLHEEEGKDDDFIQSKDGVINAHNSSDDDDDAAHVAKVEIASRIFRNYYCAFHGKYSARNFTYWNFAKKGV
uniref:Uncharacterized protein n=1 Tax=Populus trichocarpa TaxID=3694 RepID=A0A3N7FD00_POPTR